MSEEDRVVYLLASLPESYNMLVTALEANAEVPKIEIVLLNVEERRQKDRADTPMNGEKAMTSEQRTKRKGVRCHYCKRIGHIKRDCFELAADRISESERKNGKQSATVTRPR